MRGTAVRKSPRRRAVFALPLTILLVASTGFWANRAEAATSAIVDVASHWQYLNDSAGMNFTFKLTNTSVGGEGDDFIGSLEITRPSTVWKITGCPKKPNGWTATFTADKCTFIAGRGAEIPPKGTATFGVRATTTSAANNQSGNWGANVTRCFPGECPDVPATGDRSITAYGWQLTNAKVWPEGSPTVGAPCNSVANVKTAFASSSSRMVICGKNNMNAAKTTTTTFSSLEGTFLDDVGTFTGGSIPATSGDVVLGSFQIFVTTSAGSGKNVEAVIGSAGNETSTPMLFWNFTAIAP